MASVDSAQRPPARRAASGRLAALAEPPVLLLGAAMLAAAAVLLYLTRNLTFLLDEWEFLIYRRDLDATALLDPHNEHLHLIPILVYKGLLELVGMDSARPFQLAAISTFLLSCGLLFVWLRHRAGDWVALGATILILFCGAAWEDLLWAFQIGYFGSMAAGLGMLIALRRETRAGDAVACALLVAALAFSSLGIPFVVGAAVALATGPEWRRRAFVVVVPVVLYGLWWLGWGSEADRHLSATNVANAPLYVLDAIAAALSSLLGFATPRDESGVGAYDWGRVLAVAALGLAAWRLLRIGSIPRWLWVVGAIALSFWVLSAFNQIPERDPSASRYQYIGGIFVLLIAAELVRGLRIGWEAIAAILVLGAFAVLSNLSFLNHASKSYERTSELIGTGLGSVEIARDTVDPGYVLSERYAGTGYAHVEAGAYLSAVDAFGSPAFGADEIAAAGESARAAADRVLASALRIEVTPVAGSTARGADCRRVRLSRTTTSVDLPAGGVLVRASAGSRADLRLRRFAVGEFPIGAGSVSARRAVSIPIPADRAERPWQLGLTGRGTATVCPPPAA